MDARTDERLVRDALAGDAEAFSALVRRYQDHAFATAVSLLGDFDLARDVVQEAFIAAYRDLAKLKNAGNFAGWLHGIVRNMSRRALRELARVRRLAGPMGELPETADPQPRPDESAMDAERRQILRDALGRLEGPSREAVSLYYVDGLSYADIAGYLGVTEATVLGRLQRGRAKLKKELLAMVEDTLKGERLPDDFASQVRQLLEKASAESREREASIRRLTEMGGPAVDPLCEAMGDPRPVIRRLAARTLCRIGDARALRPIMRALYAGDYWLYSTVFRAGLVMHIPGAREEMLNIIREGEPGDQYWALHALGHAGNDAKTWDALLVLFRDSAADAKTRAGALNALCQMQPEVAAELVVEGLRDPGIRRLNGWGWWIALKNGLVMPLDICLTGFARDVEPNGRWTAGLLALRHGQAGEAALERLLHSDVPVEREAAAVTLARCRKPEAFDVLVQSLRHGGQERKWGRIMSRELVRHYSEQLIVWAKDERPDLSGSPELAWALAQAQLGVDRSAMTDLLHNGPPAVRAEALGRLVEQSGPAAMPELRHALAEGTPKKLAREAFWRMHTLGSAAEQTVLAMLDSPLWTERKAAVCLLRRWGKLTEQQKARAEADPHLAVRHAANWHPDWRKAAQWHERWARKIAGK